MSLSGTGRSVNEKVGIDRYFQGKVVLRGGGSLHAQSNGWTDRQTEREYILILTPESVSSEFIDSNMFLRARRA